MPEITKYLNKDGLEDYNELLPHSATQMQEYVSDWLDEHPEATTTVQPNSVTDTMLVQTGGVLSRVSDLRDDFDGIFDHGKNLFDGVWIEGYYVNQTNGVIQEAGNYHVTDYIGINSDTAYTISGNSISLSSVRYVIYDSSKTYISGFVGDSSAITFTAPADAAYVRISIPNRFTDMQLEEGSSATDYEPYTEYVKPSLVLSDPIKEDINDEIASYIDSLDEWVTPQDTTFFHISPNIINPNTCIYGYFVNQVTGALQENANYATTDWIKINPDTSYTLSNRVYETAQFRYALYNEQKTFISGGYEANPIFVTPLNARYIRVSYTLYNNTTPNDWMLAQGTVAPEYEPYGDAYILAKYIPEVSMDNVILNLPSKIYALVGYETNVYFENLTEDWAKYDWNVTCDKGMQLERGFRVTPQASDVGTYMLTINASLSDTLYVNKSTTLVIAAELAGSGDSESVMILGDSTTNNGIAVTKLNENFANDVMSITTIGTRGTPPNMHEGRSGWTFERYFTTASDGDVLNPWYNATTETFDAAHYFNETGVAKPDWFFINLGINDVFGYTNDAALEQKISACKNYCNAMIASMNETSATTNIGICLTIPPNHSQDAFGKAYGNSQTRNRYKRNNALWVQALIDEYDGRESDGIFLIPIYANLDTIYNMGMEAIPVNARNTSMTYQSPIANGGVHPVESGYWQIADVYTAFLKANV